jgi:hypothetical protein
MFRAEFTCAVKAPTINAASHVFRVFSSQRCKQIEAILPKLQRALDRPVNNQVLNWYASCSCLSIKGKIQIARQTEERGS